MKRGNLKYSAIQGYIPLEEAAKLRTACVLSRKKQSDILEEIIIKFNKEFFNANVDG